MDKIGIVLGAGVITTMITNDMSLPKLPSLQDLFSGAFKLAKKTAQKEKENSTRSPPTDKLLSQVNSLREELRMLSSAGAVNIVTTATKSGSVKFRITAIVVIGALGYFFVKWKGWKLGDMMFVTKRGFTDACANVGKQVEQVQSSITAASRHLSSRIDRADCRVDECGDVILETRTEVTNMSTEVLEFESKVKSVHIIFDELKKKLGILGDKMERQNIGLNYLLDFRIQLEAARKSEVPQVAGSSSSTDAIGPSNPSPVTRATSLPPLTIEPASPSTSTVPASPHTTPKVVRQSTTLLDSGFKEIQAATLNRSASSIVAGVPTSSRGMYDPTEQRTATSNTRLFGWRFPTDTLRFF